MAKSVVPGTTVCLLTKTSKMPGPSWSLPAHKACPRATGSICEDCYAGKGCYAWHSVQNAQHVRFVWTVQCLRSEQGKRQWVDVLVAGILKSRCTYFRVHDSGDMFNTAYAQLWIAVCKALPHVKFWIPTRSWQQPNGQLPMYDPLLYALQQLATLPNVTVRPSALDFGDHAPVVVGLHAGSAAGMPDVFRASQCPAYTQGGKCGDCRTCWDSKDTPVSYHKH